MITRRGFISMLGAAVASAAMPVLAKPKRLHVWSDASINTDYRMCARCGLRVSGLQFWTERQSLLTEECISRIYLINSDYWTWSQGEPLITTGPYPSFDEIVRQTLARNADLICERISKSNALFTRLRDGSQIRFTERGLALLDHAG